MQYALLIYTKPGTYDALSPAERDALSLEYYALRDEPYPDTYFDFPIL